MKKSDIDKWEKVRPEDVVFIAKAENIENIKFPQIGAILTLQQKLTMAPPIFNTKPYETVVGNDEIGNTFYISPNHIKGEIFLNGKYQRINKLFDGNLEDFLMTMPKVKLACFKDVEVDMYGKSGTHQKSFPFYELI